MMKMMSEQPQRRRLPKVVQACDTCRKRKTKCDGTLPCSLCQHHGFSCAFSEQPITSLSKKRKTTDVSQHNQPIRISTPRLSKRPIVSAVASSVLAADTEFNVTSPARDSSLQPGPDTVPQNGVADAAEAAEAATDPELDIETPLDEINGHNESREFHGPTGVLPFLSKLRSKALLLGSQRRGSAAAIARLPEENSEYFSLVTYLHDPESNSPSHPFSEAHPAVVPTAEREVERLCLRLFFDNLHLIHPVLIKSVFFERCEKSVWNVQAPSMSQVDRHFAALYYVVAALGAITAPEDFVLSYGDRMPGLPQAMLMPQKLAEIFFHKAKVHLGDVFEATSFDSTVTMLMMAVYCQNALRPHNCYLYSGMAVRSSLAVGLSSSGSSALEPRRRLWWALYSHELEMCTSVGRPSALTDSSFYTCGMPTTSDSDPASLITPMVAFAEITRDLHQLYRDATDFTTIERSRKAMEINVKLDEWRNTLPSSLDPGSRSLHDSDWRLKQKIVLQLRFLNANILLHRPFLLWLGRTHTEPYVMDHVQRCLDASKSTILVLHDAYLNRPYFRTWWYNTTYLLYATMVILYLLLSCNSRWPEQELLQIVQQGLDVLDSMQSNFVAKRCAIVVREVLDIATQLSGERNHGDASSRPVARPDPASPVRGDSHDFDAWAFNEELFGSLVDSNFLDSLLQADPWLDSQIDF